MKYSELSQEEKDKRNVARRRRYATDERYRQYYKDKALIWRLCNPEKFLQSVKKKQAEYKQLRENDYQAWLNMKLR